MNRVVEGKYDYMVSWLWLKFMIKNVIGCYMGLIMKKQKFTCMNWFGCVVEKRFLK